MMKLKPLGNHVLIKRSKAMASKGGILLPDSAQEKPKEGEVIACGPGKIDEDGKLEPMTVKVQDRVLFGPYAGTDVDDEFLIMKEDEVLGIRV